MASALEFARRMAHPPTTSLASVKGPSVTVTFPLDLRTRAPRALGKQPSVANSHPAFMPSSISLPIAVISSCEGGVFLSTDLYMLRNFILSSPCFEFGAAPAKRSRFLEAKLVKLRLSKRDERRSVKSTLA